MPCAEIYPLLAARRELTPGQERQVQAHLGGCTRCAERWTREERTLERMRGVRAPMAAPPPGLDHRLRAALRERRRPRRPTAPFVLAGALCIALAALLLFKVRLPWSPSGPTGQLPPVASETASPTIPQRGPSLTPARDGAAPSSELSTVVPTDPPMEVPADTEPVEPITPSPAPATATASPAAAPNRPGLIAFTRSDMEAYSGSVVVFDTISHQELRIVPDAFLVGWMPDGRSLVFERCRKGPRVCPGKDVFLLDWQAGVETQLNLPDTNRGGTAIAPDGEHLVYLSCPDDSCSAAAIMVFNLKREESRLLFSPASFSAHPSWSPLGDAIAFYDCSGSAHFCDTYTLYVQPLDGGEARQLAEHVEAIRPPAWSPDGKQIVLVAKRDGQSDIYAVNADGSGEVRLTSSPERELDPSWSPDGTRIAYSATTDEPDMPGSRNADIYVIPANGGEQTRLSDMPGQEWWPTWSPDGQFIAFIGDQPPANMMAFAPYLMRADGSGVERLGNLAKEMVWAPR